MSALAATVRLGVFERTSDNGWAAVPLQVAKQTPGKSIPPQLWYL